MFFGELAENQGDSVVIKPIYNVKGEFDPDTLIQVPIDRCDVISGRTAKTGKLYLCGLSGSSVGINLCNLSEDTAEADFDRNALIGDSVNLYLWEFDTMDTSLSSSTPPTAFPWRFRNISTRAFLTKPSRTACFTDSFAKPPQSVRRRACAVKRNGNFALPICAKAAKNPRLALGGWTMRRRHRRGCNIIYI